MNAPRTLMQVLHNLDFTEGLQADDERYVDTLEARNSQMLFRDLQRLLGWWGNSVTPTLQKHLLFFGHIGCGKTTELRHYAKALNESGFFCAIEININTELDRNNLQYPDVMMAMTRTLLRELERRGLELPSEQLDAMYGWFNQTVATTLREHSASAELKAGAETGISVPFLGKLFATLTSSLKSGVTYRNEIRAEIRDTFGQLAAIFNDLLEAAEDALRTQEPQLQRVLYILDGTDKLNDDDAIRLFVTDVTRMDEVNTLAIYTAPLHLIYHENIAARRDRLVLPMIKLNEQDGGSCTKGRSVLREILLRRADISLFADEECITALVEASGGHPRELLRLLQGCCLRADDIFDMTVVQEAIKEMAADYRRFLEPADYQLLVAKDRGLQHGGNDERSKKLLYDLALLEYNHGSWQRSHPVIRTLDGYKLAMQAADKAAAESIEP